VSRLFRNKISEPNTSFWDKNDITVLFFDNHLQYNLIYGRRSTYNPARLKTFEQPDEDNALKILINGILLCSKKI